LINYVLASGVICLVFNFFTAIFREISIQTNYVRFSYWLILTSLPVGSACGKQVMALSMTVRSRILITFTRLDNVCDSCASSLNLWSSSSLRTFQTAKNAAIYKIDRTW